MNPVESESSLQNASFRTHWLRRVQELFEGTVHGQLWLLMKMKLLKGTKLEEAQQKRNIHPDDITLTGLQLTCTAVSDLNYIRRYPKAVTKALLGSLMDVYDGMWARHHNQASIEGSWIDAAADRRAEIVMVQEIVKQLSCYGSNLPDLEHILITTCHLSTLTKAACEMCGVQTTEGGAGAMFQRRKTLLTVLHQLGIMRYLPKKFAFLQSHLLLNITNNLEQLINVSRARAQERIGMIVDSDPFTNRRWNNPAINDPNSSAHSEAGKYITIISMVRQITGIDMVEVLNNLASGDIFPKEESLMQDHPELQWNIEEYQERFTNAMQVFNKLRQV